MLVQPDSTRFVDRHSRVEDHFLALPCPQSGISTILSVFQDNIYFSLLRSSFSHIRKVIKNSGYITPNQKELCGGFQLTTNNRMDLAAIEGLKALKTRCKVTLYNNNSYLISHIKCKRYEYVNHWRCSKFPVLKWSSHFPWLC